MKGGSGGEGYDNLKLKVNLFLLTAQQLNSFLKL
jgi:hypothetical protein